MRGARACLAVARETAPGEPVAAAAAVGTAAAAASATRVHEGYAVGCEPATLQSAVWVGTAVATSWQENLQPFEDWVGATAEVGLRTHPLSWPECAWSSEHASVARFD